MSDKYISPEWPEYDPHDRLVHDWRTYINKRVREMWGTFTDEQKIAIGELAQELADNEEWE